MDRNRFIKALLILFIFGLLLNLPYFYLREFQGEEGRRVIIAENMIKTGEWIIPHVEEEIYLNKPPLYNWLLAGMFKLSGTVSEATSRLLSVIIAFLCALSLSLFWRKISGDACEHVLTKKYKNPPTSPFSQGGLSDSPSLAKGGEGGFYGNFGTKNIWFILPGLIFLTFPDVIDKAIRAEIDITFTFFITISLLSWFYFHEFKNKPLAAWVIALSFIGISFLTKGMQAPFFFYCGVIPYLAFYRKDIKGIFSLSHSIGILACIFVISIWLIPASSEIGFTKLLNVWINEALARKEPLKEGGFLRHFIQFPFSYILAYMPWVLFIGYWFHKSLRHEQGLIKNLAVFCFCCLLFSVPVYWLIPGARLRYLLPLSGMLALLITIPMTSLLRGSSDEPAWQKWYIKILGAALMLFSISAPFWGKKFDLLEKITPIIFLSSVFILGILLFFKKYHFEKKIMLLFIAVLFTKVSWASFYFPYHAENMSYYRNAAQKINELVSIDAALYDYRLDNPHLAFYLKRHIKLIRSLDKKTLANNAFIFMDKQSAEGVNLEGLSFIAELRARRTDIVLYKANGE